MRRRLSVGEEPPMLVIWGLWSCIVWRRSITEAEEEEKYVSLLLSLLKEVFLLLLHEIMGDL